MADADDALEATALALNEDAKAARKKRSKAGGDPADDEPSMGEALADLGKAVDAKEGAATDGYDLSEGAHTAAIDRMENMATEAVLSDKMLVFDVRDFLLDQIKSRPKPWSGTSQGEQRDVAAACEHAAKELVRKVVEAIAAHGADPVRVLLTKVTIGDDIVIAGKVKTFDEDEENRAVELLHKARGKHVMLTVASADDYAQGNREAETMDDEPNLGFEAGPIEDD